MGAEGPRFFAPRAWTDGGWSEDVLLSVDAQGRWAEVRPDAPAAACRGARTLPGAVLPGLVNGHSHAFQRAMAGLAERSGGAADDFWSWRERMYRAALRITPEQLEAIATQLYGELLQGGYTQVCEFHYLHNDADGRPYADPLELSLALVRAAQAAGIGLTLLPTLYVRSGFGATGLREDQRRFGGTPDSILRIAEAVNALGLPRVNAGIALHSLRAVDAGALAEVTQAARARGWPVHVHVAEQQQEVDDCLAHHGQRPIAWLLEHAPIDAHWNLVHATHTTPGELHGLQSTGASIVICPSTEANLGDGVFDLPGWAAVSGRWAIGSDSHVTRCAAEELRLLEYSQRLALRRRNIAARAWNTDSSAAALLEGALDGGIAAAGLPLAGIAVGQRADFCVLDGEAPALAGVPAAQLLDAWMFSSPGAALTQVHVAGRPVPADGPQRRAAFVQAMQALW
ncbi:MAG TPA: formimidoylglutamate deiminase [Ramlibacter sp.]|nr:formimidoylglutamate deiminase [Ramlibacter sp.]